eukprot:699206-Amphidinium_carterae.2
MGFCALSGEGSQWIACRCWHMRSVQHWPGYHSCWTTVMVRMVIPSSQGLQSPRLRRRVPGFGFIMSISMNGLYMQMSTLHVPPRSPWAMTFRAESLMFALSTIVTVFARSLASLGGFALPLCALLVLGFVCRGLVPDLAHRGCPLLGSIVLAENAGVVLYRCFATILVLVLRPIVSTRKMHHARDAFCGWKSLILGGARDR